MNGLEEESDQNLANRATNGDRAAFGEIVGRYKEPLYRFVRRYVGNGDDAYDLLQDSFLAAWMALGRYDTSRPLGPWLRTIALNKCRDFSRRQSVRRLFLNLFATQSESHTTLAESVSEDARLDQLDQAVAMLPAFYKEPLLLTAVSGLSHQETANILKTTPKAIEMRLRRARQRLAQSLAPERDKP
ncbi:MAG TPA: sigma-70 family RNA polymerase sigma factor [Rhizomicrobium sp.]|nr:sigma-70 family RNA polymerase sigma factor [Rhizomicrobium sp.]